MRFRHIPLLIALAAVPMVPQARAGQFPDGIRDTSGTAPVVDQTGAVRAKRPVTAAVEPAGDQDKRIGNIMVTYADGGKDRWTKNGNASQPRVSTDGTVGWVIVEPPVKSPNLAYALRPCRQKSN